MSTFIDNFEIRLMSGHDADQHICLVLFPEVSTETALSAANCFHVLPPAHLRILIDFHSHDSLLFQSRKLRPLWTDIFATHSVVDSSAKSVVFNRVGEFQFGNKVE